MAQTEKQKRDNKKGAMIFFFFAIILLIVTYFSARTVYRMWAWPSSNAELIEIVIVVDDDGYPEYYGVVKVEHDGAAYLADIEEPITEYSKKGDKIKVSYNPDNPTMALKFSFFSSFVPLIWLAISIALMYIGRLVWFYKGNPN